MRNQRSFKLSLAVLLLIGVIFGPFQVSHAAPVNLTLIGLGPAPPQNIILVGTHDFSAFTGADSEAEDSVRTLIHVKILQGTSEVSIEATANGFLRYMVRTLVGTLIEVGAGKRSAENVLRVLKSGDRRNAGATAPANGLTLVRVDY